MTKRRGDTPGRIRVGLGGWSFAPWRGPFYPSGLKQADELAYASRQLTAIEINATFHRTQTAESFGHWHDATPNDFIFSVKAPRAATWRRDLGASGPAIDRFLASGITQLGSKLGPLLWQMSPQRAFDPAAVASFLALLPPALDGVALRHVIEATHPSFDDPSFLALAQRHGVVVAHVETPDRAAPADSEGDFIYARLKCSSLDQPEGYDPVALDAWARRGRAAVRAGRDCFLFFIGGDKVRAPDAARAMLGRLAVNGRRGGAKG